MGEGVAGRPGLEEPCCGSTEEELCSHHFVEKPREDLVTGQGGLGTPNAGLNAKGSAEGLAQGRPRFTMKRGE